MVRSGEGLMIKERRFHSSMCIGVRRRLAFVANLDLHKLHGRKDLLKRANLQINVSTFLNLQRSQGMVLTLSEKQCMGIIVKETNRLHHV